MSNYKIDDDALKVAKRGKPQMEIYRPGSGPLPRKTGEVPETILPQKDQRKFGGVGGEREKPRGPGGGGERGGGSSGPSSRVHSEVNNIVSALLKVQDSRRNNDEPTHSAGEDTLKRNRNRKPESKLYVAKPSQNQQQNVDDTQDKSVRNNNRVNSFKEGNNRATASDTNTVDRNQKSNVGKVASDRSRGGTVSDDENSNSQSLASGRNTSDRSKKLKNEKRKTKRRGGGGGARNEANRQVNGFEEQPPEKTSQPSSVQERVVSDTYESSNSNFEHANNNINTNRNMRHASEPRVLPTAHHYGHQTNENSGNRLARDTHSMEHNDWNSSVGYGGDKGKPRDHRRHIGGNKHNKPNHHSNTELPPRFQKKKQMESTMKHIGTTSADDQWDGLSLTIHQQNSSAMYSYTAPPPPPPTHHPIHHPHPMYRTIPIFHQPHAHQLAAAAAASMPTWHNQMPMSRGRGRLRAENIPRPDIDMTRNTRSLTPERHMYANEEQHRYGMSSLQDNYTRRQYDYKVDNYNSKVDSLYESRKEPSPPTHQSNDNLTPMPQQADDKPATTSHKVENDVHSIEKPEVLPNKNQTASTERLPEAVETNDDAVFKVPASNSLDWVEEIERTERLQARSDLSRSTSVNSLHETSPRPKDQGSMKKRRDSRRKKRQGGRNDERSPSRDSRHRGSQESVDQCHWRRVEKENLSWRANSHDRTTSGGSRHNSAERWQRGGGGGGREAEWFRGREGGKDKDRRGRYRNGSRERRGDRRNRRGSSELWSNKSSDETTNWRNELKPPEPRPNDTTEHAAGAVSSGANATNSTTTNSVTSQKSPGILVLPPSSSATMTKTSNTSPRTIKTPETSDESYKQQQHQQQQPSTAQRQLFNPNNPNEPIIVASPGCRAAPPPPHIINAGPYDTGQFPVQNADLDKCRNVRDQQILMDIERCEYEIGMILTNGHIEQNWPWVMDWRFKLLEMQRVLLMTKMNFCQEKNIEQRIWKAVFHNIIEFLRKMMTDFPDTSDRCKEMLLRIIQDGIKYYEDLLNLLENNYKIKFEDYLHSNPDALKDLGLNKLTLVSAQKIYLCLGDLARYKDQVNEKEHSQRGGPNYGIARQWYIKAQQMNPKNGRPYNQLAVISCYGRRKLDAVYFYMRSLMSSNPFQSAREPLLSMFDDNRKKWESCERGRGGGARQAAPSDKEGGAANRMRRREIWIRPDGGKRVLRTTSAARSKQDGVDSEEEEVEAELKNMSYVDLNKRFCVSFLHVHGKLFTKVGMESFQEAGLAMLREFRVLLQHSPLPLTVTRFLQLLALNMFAIENTQLKNTDLDPGYRSATQECALIVSLQMFNLIVERCVQLLQTADTDNQQQQQHPTPISNLTSDVHVLLPAIKVWCDWLLCHSNVWNPPPSCRDYRVGPSGDAWTRLATLVNLLEKINTHRDFLSTEPLPDSELVRLPEDVTMSGFTPLMYNTQDPIYTNGNCDMELAQISLRIHKIMFFGTEFLCGVDPPVLKLQKYETGVSEYISVVEIPSPPVQTTSCCVVQSDNEEVCIESDDSEEEVDEKGEGESDDSGKATGVEEECGESNALDISNLRKRKEQLERSHRKQERRRQKVQAIVRECEVRVEMEVRPHYLVPDTNCLIDYLSELATIANAKTPATNEYTYSLIVPLVVISELEGLSQGAGKGVHGAWRGAQHVVRLTEAARSALHFLRSTDAHPPIKGLTTHGNTLNSNRFTQEEDYSEDMKNDDKILTACLNLSRLNSKESKSQKEDGSRRVLCEVVLLTEDRNLKLKALARDMPVSDMPNFIKWAGLG